MTAKQDWDEQVAQRDRKDMERRRAEDVYQAHRAEIDAIEGMSAVGFSANLLKIYVDRPTDQFTTQLFGIQVRVDAWCQDRRWPTPVSVVIAKL